MLKTGDVVLISQGNIFLGAVRNEGDSPRLANNADEWERFIIEITQSGYAFKQQVSNLYLGGQIQEGNNPRLVSQRKQWETFTLQNRGNGVAIKTFLNTYLVKTEQGVVCTKNVSNGNQIWKIISANGSSIQSKQSQNNSFNQQEIKVQAAKIRDVGEFSLPSPSEFPKNGDRCYIHRGGLFIGVTRDLDSNLGLTTNAQAHEKWIVEISNNKYSFKQQISGYYFGCDVKDNSSPRLAGGRLANEQFVLEKRGRGIAIKSSMNTYLTQDGTLLKWRKNPKNGSEQFLIYYDPPKIECERYGINFGNNFSFSNSNHSLPNPGALFTLSQKGKYIIRSNNQLTLSTNPQQSQKFYLDVHQNGKTVAIRHAPSGHYIGKQIQNNTSPALVNNRGDWEQYTIESRGNGNLSIRTKQNTYLTLDNNKLVWKSNIQIGKDIWSFRGTQQTKNIPIHSTNTQPIYNHNNTYQNNPYQSNVYQNNQQYNQQYNQPIYPSQGQYYQGFNPYDQNSNQFGQYNPNYQGGYYQ